jgi:hypothetical protein
VPHDKALTEYFDWTKFEDATGVRVLAALGPKELIRAESLLNLRAEFQSLDDANRSAWIPLVRAYLSKRGVHVDQDFARTNLVELDHSEFLPILERGTQEERVIFSPELVEHRLRSYLRDLYGHDIARTDEEEVVWKDAERLFWLFEAFFHLRYLERLTFNPFLPSAVQTSLGHVEAAPMPVEEDAERVYQILLDEVQTLPRPRTLAEAVKFRANPITGEFREVFDAWHQAMSSGNVDAVQRLRMDLRKSLDGMRGLGRWKRVNGWLAYLGVPLGIVGLFVAAPAMAATGIAAAVVGAVGQATTDLGDRRRRWMFLQGNEP